MSKMAAKIETRLKDAFTVAQIHVADVSEAHRGHAGHREGGESHFEVKLAAAEFADMTRLQRHRAVHKALGAEIIGTIHALALDLSSPA